MCWNGEMPSYPIDVADDLRFRLRLGNSHDSRVRREVLQVLDSVDQT